jgi:hypothetical protein
MRYGSLQEKPTPKTVLATVRKLNDKFTRVMQCVGASPVGDTYAGGNQQYVLQTRYGRLTISPYILDHDKQCKPWIATKFEEAKRAMPATGCNEYTGKWNFHCFDWATIKDDSFIMQFEASLDAIVVRNHLWFSAEGRS